VCVMVNRGSEYGSAYGQCIRNRQC
jgi:hypothetical protein